MTTPSTPSESIIISNADHADTNRANANRTNADHADLNHANAGCADTNHTNIDCAFDPIAYLNHPRWQEVKPGLERITALMEALGNPQDDLKFVHVAGTNGKGSTSAMVAAIAREAGYKTGLFTSPYITKFEERIQIDGMPISLDDLTRVTLDVKAAADAMPEHPTEFELMTAVALCYFAQAQCDLVVLEVGLGGRLDSTNVIAAPEVCVITPIGLDHTAVLGTSLTAIAREKAGIIKPGARAVSAPQAPLVSSALAFTCTCYYVPLVTVDLASLVGTNADFSYTASNGVTYQHMSLALVGAYQRTNAAVALETALALREQGWTIPDEAIVTGLAHASWIGRFQVIEVSEKDEASDGSPDRLVTVIVDGAHNPDGVQALVQSLREYRAERALEHKPVLVMSVLADKDYAAMIDTLAPEVSAVFAATPANPRALEAAHVATAFNAVDSTIPIASCTSIAEAVAKALDCAQQHTPSPERPLVVCCGSLYAVADYLAALESFC